MIQGWRRLNRDANRANASRLERGFCFGAFYLVADGERGTVEITVSHFMDSITPRDNARQPVVILGMHRSGTSALAGVLQKLGVEFGSDLIGASPSNPKGHFEMTAAVRLNDHLLRRVFGARWKTPFALPEDWRTRVDLPALTAEYGLRFPAHPLFGLKDPRLCRLMPVWRELLQRETPRTPRFVLMVRRPQEVAASLAHRDDLPREAALDLWREHVQAAERTTRDAPRMVLTYEQLLNESAETSARLAGFLDVPPPDSAARAAIHEFLDPHLRHHAGVPRAPLAAFSPLDDAIYDAAREHDLNALGRALEAAA